MFYSLFHEESPCYCLKSPTDATGVDLGYRSQRIPDKLCATISAQPLAEGTPPARVVRRRVQESGSRRLLNCWRVTSSGPNGPFVQPATQFLVSPHREFRREGSHRDLAEEE